MRSTSIFAVILNLALSSDLKAQDRTERSTLIDNDWRFYRGGNQGAERVNFDETKWRKIDLPHDWSIEDLPGTNSPFNPNAIRQVNADLLQAAPHGIEKHLQFRENKKAKKRLFSSTVFI
jgi:beta-galactosidase